MGNCIGCLNQNLFAALVFLPLEKLSILLLINGRFWKFVDNSVAQYMLTMWRRGEKGVLSKNYGGAVPVNQKRGGRAESQFDATEKAECSMDLDVLPWEKGVVEGLLNVGIYNIQYWTQQSGNIIETVQARMELVIGQVRD